MAIPQRSHLLFCHLFKALLICAATFHFGFNHHHGILCVLYGIAPWSVRKLFASACPLGIGEPLLGKIQQACAVRAPDPLLLHGHNIAHKDGLPFGIDHAINGLL
jgi:hypothetical protein